MLKLVVLPPAFGLTNVSPFCLKAEMVLRWLDLAFEKGEEADPRKAPKGRLPYLITPEGTIADSDLMLQWLDDHTQGRVFGGLSAADNARGLALTRLAEEHLYWLLMASRWADDAWWPNVVEGFFYIAPRPVRGLVAGLARRGVLATLHGQGLGRHNRHEQEGFARRDLQALADSVPADGFLFGASPSVHDLSIAALLATLYDQQPVSWLNPIAEEFPGLKAWVRRVAAAVGVTAR